MEKKKISIDELEKVLTPKEMKHLLGGGSCGFKGIVSGVPSELCWNDRCGLSMGDAMAWASYCNTYWCCDNCGSNGGSASYC